MPCEACGQTSRARGGQAPTNASPSPSRASRRDPEGESASLATIGNYLSIRAQATFMPTSNCGASYWRCPARLQPG